MPAPRRVRPTVLIPRADTIRTRLYRARAEVQLLSRLLRLAERRNELFPAARHPEAAR